ncbi:hypothetical protein [Gimesia aquarii]|uniref:Uncharacterized protein n=1 Tax=Gimesia aquarii TaxID=2527964 RepID=A0A517W2D7_9PLAN|nr:hypothetical protein [Gimesia aquarii]QDT99400.1 hypothetical protein V144x_49110 [Gimesia aquarii]
MKKLSTFLTLLFLVGTLPLLSGCGKSKEQPGQSSAKPLGPAESMTVMIDGVSNQKMEAVWEFLPASYQTDINGLVKEFATKMDPEMYNGTFQTAQRLTKLLKDKKAYILKNQTIKGLPVPPDKVDQFWDPTISLLNTIVQSDISNLDKLKDFDGGKFLSTTGNQLAKSVISISDLIPTKENEPSFSEKMKQTKVTVVSTEGDTATIKIEAPGEEPKEETMVKVEGKWIPKNLADNWKSKMEEAHQKLAELTPEKVTAQKEQTLAGLKKMNEVLAQLENAKTEEEFNQTLTPIVAPVAMFAPMLMMQMGQSMMGAPQGGPMTLGGPQSLGESNAADPETVVTIVIDKKLSNAEQDPIIDELIKVVDGANILPNVVGETTVIRVSPVKNVEEFAKKIKFGKTTKVDPKTRSINVELAK